MSIKFDNEGTSNPEGHNMATEKNLSLFFSFKFWLLELHRGSICLFWTLKQGRVVHLVATGE